jgi:PKD repeat protein
MTSIFKRCFTHRRQGNAFGILFSLIVLLIALPLWVGALIERDPYVNNFSANAENGFYIDKEINFTIKGGDKQDDYLDAYLNFDDGKQHNFKLRKNKVYVKNHTYNNAGLYNPRLTLKDTVGREITLELSLEIKDKDYAAIENFSFNKKTSNNLGERVYLDYKIDCYDKDDYEASIDWGDNVTTLVDIFYGPAITSHLYEEEGSYDIKLILEDCSSQEITNKELRVIIGEKEEDEEEEEEENRYPQARFFLRTAWPTAGQLVYFQEAVSDPDGRTDLKEWLWNFGDGVTSRDLNPTHRYNQAGNYKVSLRAEDKAGNVDTYYQWITVAAQPTYNLVRVVENNRIYEIINGQYHWIPNPAIFLDYGFKSHYVQDIHLSNLGNYSRAKLLQVKGTKDIYYLTESYMKRRIPNMQVFYSYGNQLEDVITVSKFELDWYPINHLIKYDNDWRIYYLDNDTKHWIKNSYVFENRDFQWDEIAPINKTEFNSYPTGEILE